MKKNQKLKSLGFKFASYNNNNNNNFDFVNFKIIKAYSSWK